MTSPINPRAHRPSILIVEDDENLRFGLEENLKSAGYETRAVASAEEAEASAKESSFDLIILDIMLPGMDGYTLCRRIRESGFEAAVLMLTARTLEDDLVRGFDAGADDYLAKPYRLRELMARVAALLRRKTSHLPDTFEFAGFSMDLGSRILTDSSKKPIQLTRTEFDLLSFLLRNRDRALSRDEILDNVWGSDIMVDPRTVDNFVSSLKKKLRWTRRSPFRINTVRGLGYRMEIDDEESRQ